MADSRVGKTAVKGHGLRGEGRERYAADGTGPLTYRVYEGCARCRCGELSEPGLTQADVQRWHRAHKEEVSRG